MEEEQEEKRIETFEEEFEKFIGKAKEEVSFLKTELNDVTELYNDFVKKPSAAVPSKAEKLNETFEKVTEYNTEISEIETKVQEFETKVFGKNTEDKEALKFKITELRSELEELHSDWEEKYGTLSTKIESLLPGATSAGLAKSYHDQKKSYKTPNILWSIVFIGTMIGMVWYAVTTIEDSETVGGAFMNILARTPFFVPTIWLALFASKQQSQNRRLEQEYAHKESLAKSYEGYKREIAKLPESSNNNEIMEKLVASLIDASSYNPSETLEKKSHNDSPPLLSSLMNRKGDNSE
tara:strand:+ start:770 stop:1654 length:885 start_codon:yes stop_codon:yes gene_type:complete